MLVLHLSPQNVSTLEDAFPATQGATTHTHLVWAQLAQFANLRAACEQIIAVLED
jgi:hypothetical protein